MLFPVSCSSFEDCCEWCLLLSLKTTDLLYSLTGGDSGHRHEAEEGKL